MARETFHRDLEQLQDEILMMGSRVSVAIEESVKALKARDQARAQHIIQEDSFINVKRYEIEDKALFLIASQQPMARDVRLLAGVLEITTEMERIGDYAKGIGKITKLLGSEPHPVQLHLLPQMAHKSVSMLRRSLDAFVERDADAARAIIEEDDEVDALYNRAHRELLDAMLDDSSVIDRASYLLWAAHNLERTGDRVTNICERIIFMVTGQIEDADFLRLKEAASV